VCSELRFAQRSRDIEAVRGIATIVMKMQQSFSSERLKLAAESGFLR
jgi:hypothetical protein